MRLERWRTVTCFPKYEVSDRGRVRNNATGRILKPCGNGTGHLVVYLYAEGVRHTKCIHVLMLEAFVGPCPPGKECRHLNGKPADNRLPNLKWGTHAENMKDKIRHGTHRLLPRGEDHSRAKLTATAVRRIRKMRSRGVPTRTIADKFGVGGTTVYAIIEGRTWTHV